MKLSAKTEYACIAMLELAGSYSLREPVRIRAIAEQHDIPQRFLVQILLQLKGAGLVASTRGATGGYQLLKPPEETTLADVVSVIDGPPNGHPVSNASPESDAARVVMKTWSEIASIEWSMLGDVTFADLLGQMHELSDNMYYI